MVTERIQELESQLASTTNKEQKIDLLNELALELRYSDLGRAINLSEEGLDLSGEGDEEDQPYRKGMANSLLNLGLFSAQVSNYDSALSYYFEALELFGEIDDVTGRASVINAIGQAYSHLGNYPEALEHYLKALSIFQDIGNRELEAGLLKNIGYLNLYLNKYEEALKYLNDSLSISEEIGAVREQADALDKSCKVYFSIGDYDNALTCGHKSVEHYREMGDRQGEAEVLNSLGDVYFFQGDYDKALTHFEKSLQICEEIGLKYEAVRAQQRIGSVNNKKGRVDEAIEQLEEALKTAERIGAKQEMYECHRTLAEIYKQSGDFIKALTHYEGFHNAKEEMFNTKTDARLKRLELVHQVETARKDAEIYRLENISLQQEVVEHEQLIADLNAFAHMVAHDLKTPLHNIMTASSLLLDNISGVVGAEPIGLLRGIQRMVDKMSSIIDELLTLASVRQEEITPRPLDMEEVIKEVEVRLAHLIDEHQAVIVKPQKWPEALGYAPWVEEVWANYVSNAIRYGGDPPCLELGADPQVDGRVCFWVRDNGAGLNPEDQAGLFEAFTRVDNVRAQGYGLGLSIVRRIVEKLGGEVGVESEGVPGRGSKFSFTLPGASK
jgi:signal transduction histidine kinase